MDRDKVWSQPAVPSENIRAVRESGAAGRSPTVSLPKAPVEPDERAWLCDVDSPTGPVAGKRATADTSLATSVGGPLLGSSADPAVPAERQSSAVRGTSNAAVPAERQPPALRGSEPPGSDHAAGEIAACSSHASASLAAPSVPPLPIAPLCASAPTPLLAVPAPSVFGVRFPGLSGAAQPQGEWPSPRPMDGEGHITAPQPSPLGRGDAGTPPLPVCPDVVEDDDAGNALYARSINGSAGSSSGLPVGGVARNAAAFRTAEAPLVPHASRSEQDEGDWSGRVAAERPEGALLDRLPASEVPPRVPPHGLPEDAVVDTCRTPTSGVPAARRQLYAALQALRSCEGQLRRAAENDLQLRRSLQASTAEAAEAKAEADALRRELQRLRGHPRDLSVLANEQLHTLQQDLSDSLRNVHTELENRSKCCVCRFQDREVVLQPCMHLVLCRACALRVTSCPLCRKEIQSHSSVRVA